MVKKRARASPLRALLASGRQIENEAPFGRADRLDGESSLMKQHHVRELWKLTQPLAHQRRGKSTYKPDIDTKPARLVGRAQVLCARSLRQGARLRMKRHS